MRAPVSLLVAFTVITVLAGCQQQQSSQWGQGSGQSNPVVAPPSAVRTPDEIRNLEAIAKQNPKNANAWIALGNVQMDAQRFAEAVASYERAVALDPKNTDVLVDLGTCYRGSGQPEKALELYRRALKINPNHLNANRNSGVVLSFDLNRPAEGIKAFEKYLQLAPNAPDTADIRREIEQMKARR